jgi:adenylate cyclase class 2
VKHEYEAKFLSIDVADLQAKLTALGAVQAFPRTLLTRRIFENGALGGAWIRLRDEGTRSTMALKQVADSTSIDGTTEIETEVTDFVAMAEILSQLGLREVRYQENYREEWRWGETAELGRDILAESTLLFANGTADGERSESPGTS